MSISIEDQDYQTRLKVLENQVHSLLEQRSLKRGSIVVLNARGTRFEILEEHLFQFPDRTRLGKLKYYQNLTSDQLLDLCDHYSQREFYFDRDPDILKFILSSDCDKIHIASYYCQSKLRGFFCSYIKIIYKIINALSKSPHRT